MCTLLEHFVKGILGEEWAKEWFRIYIIRRKSDKFIPPIRLITRPELISKLSFDWTKTKKVEEEEKFSCIFITIDMVPPVTAFLREILLNYNPKFIWDIFLAITQGKKLSLFFTYPSLFLKKIFPQNFLVNGT
jgi:hypothetical protein